MELNKRAKKYLEVGNIEKAKEEIISLLNTVHKEEWKEAKKVEYLQAFPKYRDMTEEEYYRT